MPETVGGSGEPLGFPRCRTCALRLVSRPEVCAACRASSASPLGQPAAGTHCPVCAQTLEHPGPCPNRWCGRADRAFSVVFSVGIYDAALRGALHRYKFRGERWWASVFARLLAGELLGHSNWFEEFQLIVGMPTYRGPGARRPWDPIAVILQELEGQMGEAWELHPEAVRKVAETPRLSGRSRWERERIAQGAFRAALRIPAPSLVQGARVLVVDDVFTEGSSLQEVARLLRRSGAEEVAGLVLGRPAWAGSQGDRDPH